MALVYLGPTSNIRRLPSVKWLKGNKPSLTVGTNKQIEQAQMSDGTIRYAMFQEKREWFLYWGFLNASQLVVFQDIRSSNETLRFQDNWESDTWYDVIMVSFSHAPIDSSLRSSGYYSVTLKLVEV